MNSLERMIIGRMYVAPEVASEAGVQLTQSAQAVADQFLGRCLDLEDLQERIGDVVQLRVRVKVSEALAESTKNTLALWVAEIAQIFHAQHQQVYDSQDLLSPEISEMGISL